MAKFLTALDVVMLSDTANSDRGAWQLMQDLVYDSDVTKCTLTVPIGFVTDFASVPRLPVVFDFVGDVGHEASALHDFLYTTRPFARRIADAVLEEALIASGISKLRAFSMWIGVRIFGGAHWGLPD